MGIKQNYLYRVLPGLAADGLVLLAAGVEASLRAAREALLDLRGGAP
jgi:hypothetical protein